MTQGAIPAPVTEPPLTALFWRAAPFIFLIFWSGGYPIGKLSLDYIEPLTLLVWRYALAVLALVPFLFLHRPVWPKSARHWGAIAVTGFLIQCVYFGLAYFAMKQGMNAGTTAIIMALQPAVVAAVLPLLGQGHSGWLLWTGIGIGFAGVVLVVASQGALGPSPSVAILLALGALAGISGATLFEKWHGMKTDPVVGGIVQYAVGFAILLPVAWLSETMVADWQPELVLSLAYLTFANSVIAIGLFIALIQRGDATRLSSLMYLVPPLAMAMSWLILGEPMGLLAFAGLALSVGGVQLVARATG
ncbi:MAG: DMT family transporter [Rubellimicrobium sp.]|nr:DMT family transporter [Rubellimicrobium sp.]